MKTLNYLAMIFAVLLTACTKEADILQPMKPKNSIPGLQVEVQNGMLFFKDAIEYASFIEKSSADSLLDIISDYDGFTSCYEWMSDSNEVNFMHSIQEESETILKLLNKDGLVHIQNKVYRINSKTETVYMIDSSRANNPAAIAALIAESGDGVTSESVERDLYELNGLPDAKGYALGGCPTINQANSERRTELNSVQAGLYSPCNSGDRFYGVAKYRSYGIYFELVDFATITGSNCTSSGMHTIFASWKRNGSGASQISVSNQFKLNQLPFFSSNTSPLSFKANKYYKGARRLCNFVVDVRGKWNTTTYATNNIIIKHNYVYP